MVNIQRSMTSGGRGTRAVGWLAAAAVGAGSVAAQAQCQSGWLDISPQLPDVDWAAVWGTGPDDFFVVGTRGLIVRYQAGRPWTIWELVSGVDLESVWGTGNGDIFAVGENGVIMHFDGYVWEQMESGTSYPLLSVHGRSSYDVFAVGQGGTILHFDGIVWTPSSAGTTGPLEAVWCRPSDETVIVGEAGLSLHSADDGNGHMTWQSRGSGAAFPLFGITGDSDGNVYAAGTNGLVMKYAGEGWDILPTGHHDQLDAIAIDPCGDLYCAGYWGVILKYTK